ncbi:MAG TPA: hypothetical protein VMG08_02435 [Allosphingosinicella sp.]|nr:hypothetical protein [Allosphingosinicella sp.]
MKFIPSLAAAAALLGLGACDRLSPSGQSAANEKARTAPSQQQTGPNAVQASSTSSLPATNGQPDGQGLAGNPNAIPATSTLTPTVDRAFLIGRWTDARDCHESGQFTADGRYINTAGQTAAWTLEGDQLTLTFDGAPPRTLRVSAADQNSLNVINPDGSTGRSTRC